MITVFLSGVCALLVILAFVGGVAFGLELRSIPVKEKEAIAEEVAEKKRKQMEEDNEAFQTLMGYDINKAYGVRSDDS